MIFGFFFFSKICPIRAYLSSRRPVVIICLFQGCLTLWIIRTAARRRPRPKGEVVSGEGGGWRAGYGDGEGRWCQRIDTDLSFSPTPVPRRRRPVTLPLAYRSAHVISVAGARGCPPPSFFPYGVHIIYTPSVRPPPPPSPWFWRTYTPPSRAHCGRACPRCRRQYHHRRAYPARRLRYPAATAVFLYA